MDDAMDCLMSFSDFLFAFQIQFYYSGESLPGPRGSCGTTVPHSPSGPVAAPPASLARTFCTASLHGGLPRRMCRSRRWSQDPPHDTESHGASRQRGTHISLSDSHGHTPTGTRCCGAVPKAFPLSEDVLCAGPSARHLRPHRSPEGQVALLREKRTEGSCQRAGLPGGPEGPPCQRGRRSLPGPDAAV